MFFRAQDRLCFEIQPLDFRAIRYWLGVKGIVPAMMRAGIEQHTCVQVVGEYDRASNEWYICYR